MHIVHDFTAIPCRYDVPPETWWDDLETKGAIAPAEVGRHLGLSESAATSLLCLLAQAGKVRICLVENAVVHDRRRTSPDDGVHIPSLRRLI